MKDWSKLYFGPVTREEVKECTDKHDWQFTRELLKGQPLNSRYDILEAWLKDHDYDRRSQVQVTNYVTALSRGGMLRPSDYREVTKW